MDEHDFQARAAQTLEDLARRLADAGERYGFESDFQSGAVTVEFEDPPARFVVSPNSPVRQIWVSAHSKSFKLEWDPARKTFALPGGGQTLLELMARAAGEQLGANVSL
jgi:CyaY protein